MSEEAAPPAPSYRAPTRAIFNDDHLASFQASQAYEDLTGFVVALNEAAKDKTLSSIKVEDASHTVQALGSVLDKLHAWVDEIPPIEQPMRFGNKAYRTWQARLEAEAENLVKEIMPEAVREASVEVAAYFKDSFGNGQRLDYGTGHETNFIVFLLCLKQLGVIADSDLSAVALPLFNKYLRVCRHLQRTYWLEPAGSHGVWSLDDYHMLPFLFGSAQLFSHRHMKPRSIHSEETMEGYGHEYMYFQCIAFVKSVKHGAPFAEHSPMLNDISAVKTWSKVNEGMLKMYKGEVLAKTPVMQHLHFGTLFPASWAAEDKIEE